MNLKTKTNTVKQILAKVMLVILLLTSVLGLSGCVKSQLTQGQYFDQTYSGTRYGLRVVSNTKEFDLDNVTFQLNIGIHKKEYSLIDWLTTDIEVLLSKSEDVFLTFDNYSSMYYVIYIANPDMEEIDFRENILKYDSVLRYKEISYSESYKDGKYNYSRMPLSGKIYYNNCETITIPKDYFVEGEYNTIYIGVCYTDKTNPDNPLEDVSIGLSYHINDDGTVTIGFPNRE